MQVTADFNGGETADIFVRYSDANNGYRIRLQSPGENADHGL